jgi:hypothetical protein
MAIRFLSNATWRGCNNTLPPKQTLASRHPTSRHAGRIANALADWQVRGLLQQVRCLPAKEASIGDWSPPANAIGDGGARVTPTGAPARTAIVAESLAQADINCPRQREDAVAIFRLAAAHRTALA